MIGASATRKNLANADWSISQGSERGISQIEVKTVYQVDNDTMLRVGTITFDQEYSIQDILNNNVNSSSVSRVYAISTPSSTMETNLDLGKTVIQTIDADNNLKGDIWCNIVRQTPSNGQYIVDVTVYQITENGVTQYDASIRMPHGSNNADEILKYIDNIEKTNSQTEYTFAGEKIEQASASYQNLATYNYYFDEDIELC